jgi:hypothetical protein
MCLLYHRFRGPQGVKWFRCEALDRTGSGPHLTKNKRPPQVFYKGTEIRPMTKTDDKSRKWLWWFLAVGVALQLYFVRELLAAFALFAAGFAVIALLIAALYMIQKGWEVGVARFTVSQSPAASMARRAVSAMEELGRRPFRRPV